MSPEIKLAFRLVADNIFWVFLIVMIILGSVVDAPFITVEITDR
jgi:hypothetical protein